MDFMRELEARRKSEGHSLKWFAASLGISRGAYYKLVNGEMKPSDRFRARALRRYPDLAPHVLDDILQATA